MSDKIGTTAKPVFFTDIVGLRIYLALWVAVGHGLQLSGFLEDRIRCSACCSAATTR